MGHAIHWLIFVAHLLCARYTVDAGAIRTIRHKNSPQDAFSLVGHTDEHTGSFNTGLCDIWEEHLT